MKCRDDYRTACKKHKEGWQTYREFGDKWQLMTGNGVSLDLDGYSLPDKALDRARVGNDDLRGLPTSDLAEEWSALDAADKVYGSLKHDGLRGIQICLPLGGATDWEEWSKERRETISRLIMYGR